MKMANWGNLLHIKSDNNTFRKNKIIVKITEIIRFYKVPFIAIARRIAFIVAVTLIGQLLLLLIDLIN
jgi:hypothetical protein